MAVAKENKLVRGKDLYYVGQRIKENFVAKEDGKGLSTNDYTTDEKTKLAGIESGAQKNVKPDWNAASGDAQILHKPSIPTKTSDLTNDSGFVTSGDIPEGVQPATANPLMDGAAAIGSSAKYAKEDHVHPSDSSKADKATTLAGYGITNAYTKAEVDTAISNKQDTITDLASIRSGAAAGSTAVQPAALNAKQDTIADLPDIRSGAALGSTSVQPADIENMVEAEPIGSIVPPVNPSENTVKLTKNGQPVFPVTDESLVMGLNYRPYDSENPNGMGYLVLKKNKTFAEQVTEANTIYEIRYAFDLGGASVTIPEGCVLKFSGGYLSNGMLVGTNTCIKAGLVKIFDHSITFSGTFLNNDFAICWYGAESSTDKNNPVDAYSAIQQSLDIDTDSGFKTIYFPAGLWYISSTLVLSKIKNLHLDGYSNDTRMSISAFKTTAVVFSNLDIDLLVVDQALPSNTQLGFTIEGGQFDVSLVSGYTHSAIHFMDTYGETMMIDCKIETAIFAEPNSVSSESRAIYFDLTNGGYITTFTIKCSIKFFTYGISDNIGNSSWGTELADYSSMACKYALKLTSIASIKSYGVYQALPYFQENDFAVIDASSRGTLSFFGYVWDVNVGSGNARTQRYAIKAYPECAIFNTPEIERYVTRDLIANVEYYTLSQSEYAPVRRVANSYFNRGYDEIENVLLDDGSFTISSECATGMLFRWVENAFSTKATRPARYDFQTVTEDDAWIKTIVTFNAITYLNHYGFIIHAYDSYFSAFKYCEVKILNNSSAVVYTRTIDLEQKTYNTAVTISIPLLTEFAAKTIEFKFYKAKFKSITYGEVFSFFARARGTGNQANHKYITTEGKGLAKIYNSSGVVVENFELPKSGTSANRPTTGLYVGFEYFDTTLGKPIYYKAANTWVDATGTAV